MRTTGLLVIGLIFLGGCGAKEVWKTTESGLKYADIVEGTGEMPYEEDSVKVHYTGRLENGRQFDSSHIRGEPMIFQVSGGAIKGFLEGIATMKVGGKRKLIIPPDLAYGEQGMLPKIPANATLHFEVELVEIME